MKTILCYGDSNTWGYIPGSGDRYPYAIRWTGILQKRLGNRYRVIEEGLSGRYTVWDDPFRTGRNGSKLLLPLLESHAPIDLIILMLGTNDVLHIKENTAYDAAKGCSVLVEIIQRSQSGVKGRAPSVLLVSPPRMSDLSENLALQCHGSPKCSHDFSKYYQQVSKELRCRFLDAAEVCEPSDKDGVHLDQDDHLSLALAMEEKIKFLKF